MYLAVCPHCGQPMLMRHGVRLTAKLAVIFDLIERSGDRGVMIEVLAGAVYPGVATRVAVDRVRVQVHKINDRFEEIDKRVRMQPRHDGPYRVITIKPRRRINIEVAA